jgi:hypothetical protein
MARAFAAKGRDPALCARRTDPATDQILRLTRLRFAINLTPIGDPDYQNRQDVVLDLVDDPVIAGADPPSVALTDQFRGFGRPRILRQQCDDAFDP